MIVTPGQLARRSELYHQLGSMIGGGVPLLKGLEMVSRNPDIRASRSTVTNLIRAMQSGLTFSESMTQVHGWMPEFDVALLSVGEQAGRLDQTFKLLSTYYASRAQIIRDTVSGLLTTTATLHVFLLVFPLHLLQACAVGIFYGNYSLCIPFLVEKFIVFGSIYAVIFFLIYACQGQRGESWRSLIESVLGVIPILRKARKYLILSRLAASLEATISSGLPIIGSWEMAGAASGSPALKGTILHWKPHLESGSTPGELINESRYFPEMFANLYNTGEQSGRLDDSLQRLQAYYQEEGFRKLRLFTYIMNGTIYGLIVLLIAYNVISFYMGYYSGLMNSVN